MEANQEKLRQLKALMGVSSEESEGPAMEEGCEPGQDNEVKEQIHIMIDDPELGEDVLKQIMDMLSNIKSKK